MMKAVEIAQGQKVRWDRDRRGRWFGHGYVKLLVDRYQEDVHSGDIIPSRSTEGLVCPRHGQAFRLTGRLIQTAAPCDICPHLDRWDTRIAEWASANTEAFKASVLADCDKMMSQYGVRPAEWGLQEVPAVLRDSFPWDKREMRKFLNRERETPPMSNWERAEKGLPLQDT